MKRFTIIETLTRWHVEIPDGVKEADRNLFAWAKVLKVANHITSKGMKVQLDTPPEARHLLVTPKSIPEKKKKKSGKSDRIDEADVDDKV